MRSLEVFLCLILATLVASVAIFVYRKGVAENEFRQCCTNLKVIGTALETYGDDNSWQYPRSGPEYVQVVDLAILTPRYLSTVPHCPTGAPYHLTTSA